MMPKKMKGWMVNFAMRRVEPVKAEESPFNMANYGRYRGPKRTYMLHSPQVFDSELAAMEHLQALMTKRHVKLVAQLLKYGRELNAVNAAVRTLERKP